MSGGSKDKGVKLRSASWFNNPDNPSHDGALSRAAAELRPDARGIAVRQADHRHRPDRLGPLALQPPPSRPGRARARGHPRGRRHRLRISRSIRSRRRGKRPTAALDRNLAYLGLVEVLYGYPIDGVVLTIGCDKTTPACLMAAATVNIPAIALSVGPMLNGWWKGERTGSGTIVWKARQDHAAGEIGYEEIMDIVASSAPSTGYCNTMGTATTMNSLAEALGMQLPGSAAIPAPYRERSQIAYETGKRIVEMVREDLKPSDIMTREAFENAIVVNSAIGGSTNAPIHINAIARHIGVELEGRRLADDRPQGAAAREPAAGRQISRRGLPACRRRAGGGRRIDEAHGLIHESALTVNGKTIGDNCRGTTSELPDVIRTFDTALVHDAGFIVPERQPVRFRDHEDQRDLQGVPRPLSVRPQGSRRLRGPGHRLRGAGGLSPPHRRSRARTSTSTAMLFMRGAGPIGYPGGAEVVNMQPPAALIKRGITSLPCIGDGRQSGTSGSPSILNASPEAAAGGGLALLRDRRPGAHRPRQGRGQYPDLRRGAGRAPRRPAGQRRLPLSRPPDALAGNPARRWSTSSARAWC